MATVYKDYFQIDENYFPCYANKNIMQRKVA